MYFKLLQIKLWFKILDVQQRLCLLFAGNSELRPMSSPPREDRIAAIKQTAAELKHRLESEAWRLGLNLQATGHDKIDEQQPLTTVSSGDYTVFKGALPGRRN